MLQILTKYSADNMLFATEDKQVLIAQQKMF